MLQVYVDHHADDRTADPQRNLAADLGTDVTGSIRDGDRVPVANFHINAAYANRRAGSDAGSNSHT